jgi:hypothetical protein
LALLGEDRLRELVERVSAIDRPSASPGERRAAELIAAEMEAAGGRARLEEETVHGTYWWPIGLLTGLAALAGLTRRRGLRLAAGAFAAAAAADDVTAGPKWFRRRFLPKRTTTNVVAEIGDPDAPRTVVLVSHHDAAHSGIVFHPELPRWLFRRRPDLLEKANTTPGTLWGAVAGPLMVALFPRRLGIFICLGYVASMADIGARAVVPGANDNATAVAALVSLAHSLADDPLPGVRVILVSTGSEESFMEGMQAFGRRHFPSLPTDSTHVICVDTVGSPHLLALEGEGMLWMNEYPKDFLAVVKRCADELGVYLFPNLRLRNATDGLVALRAGYPTVTFGSVDEFKIPTNYHWPTDTADNVDYGTVADCARLCRRILDELAASTASPRA